MLKKIFLPFLCFISMFMLFTVCLNGISFILLKTLFVFLDYAQYSQKISNPLYVLFLFVFACFSLPSVLILSVQSGFSVKKRLLLLLESHAFFFFWQVLFWLIFGIFTLHYSRAFLELIVSLPEDAAAAVLACIYMPIILMTLIPLLCILFIWTGTRTSLFLIKDEERNEFSFAAEPNEKLKRIFDFMSFADNFLLLCLLAMFLPLHYAPYLPRLSTQPLVFLLCFLQYFSTKLIKKERRRCLFAYGFFIQTGMLGYALFMENDFYKIIFFAYFLLRIFLYGQALRFGKDVFVKA